MRWHVQAPTQAWLWWPMPRLPVGADKAVHGSRRHAAAFFFLYYCGRPWLPNGGRTSCGRWRWPCKKPIEA